MQALPFNTTKKAKVKFLIYGALPVFFAIPFICGYRSLPRGLRDRERGRVSALGRKWVAPAAKTGLCWGARNCCICEREARTRLAHEDGFRLNA